MQPFFKGVKARPVNLSCTSSTVGTRLYGNPLATLFTHYPIVWTVKNSVFGTRVLAVL